MAKYIDKQAATAYAPLPRELREYQTVNLDDAFEYGYDFAIGQIDAIPAADVVPASDFRDCRNELCLKCGAYTQKHNGACDGCRWR